MSIDAVAYLARWHRDPAAARAEALALGPARLGLAVALSALHAPGTLGSTYTYWLRAWDCPPVPPDLRTAGWQWDTAGTMLVRQRGIVRMEVHTTGVRALEEARMLTASPTHAPPTLTQQAIWEEMPSSSGREDIA